MRTIEELVYYCNQKKPVGAFLLKGEWGCGKTYLIEHELRKELEDSHIIIRVSLFGIASIEEFHRTIKNAWIEQTGVFPAKAKKYKGFFDFIGKFKDAIPDDSIKGIAGGLLSIDFSTFIKIGNEVDKKKVVLVFDDLERSRLSTVEVLGAINEYCENQQFNVIIIADEDKLGAQPTGTELSFKDIKEKVVQRTVHVELEHSEIVTNVIKDIQDETYHTFLLSRQEDISTLFAGKTLTGDNLDKEAEKNISSGGLHRSNEETTKAEKHAREIMKRRPHNIRSMKAAIQDFQRVYNVLIEYHVEDTYRWLWSFLAFSMGARANLIQKHEEYNYIFRNRPMDLLYPGYYDSRYFPDSLVYWVMEGRWDEKALREYIELHYTTDKDTPSSFVKSTRIDWLNEEIAQRGMNDVVEDVYNGKLSYNQYVMFITNVKLAREYGLEIIDVDWNKVRDAINHKINADILSTDEFEAERHREVIGDLKDYTEEEKRTYAIISNMRDQYTIILGRNRKEYISLMRSNPEAALILQRNNRFNCFDSEMARATIKVYPMSRTI